MFALVACSSIGIVVTLFSRPESGESMRGLVWGTISDALARYKGSPGVEDRIVKARGLAAQADGEEVFVGEGHLPEFGLSQGLAKALEANEGDLIYVTDPRKWLGGLRSCHGIVGWVEAGSEPQVFIRGGTYNVVAGSQEGPIPVAIEKLY